MRSLLTISEKIKVVFHDIINVQSSIVSLYWWWWTDLKAVIIFLLSCIVISVLIDKIFSMIMSYYSYQQAHTRSVNQKNWTMTINILNHFCVSSFLAKNVI